MVCHASDRIMPVGQAHALAFPTGTQKNVSLAINNVDVDNTRHLVVTFTATDPAALTTVAAADLRVYLAGYDPSTVTTGGSGFFRYYAQERTGTGNVIGTLANNGGGSYTYTTATSLTAAPATTTTQRFFIGVSKGGENTGNVTFDFDLAAATANTNGLASVANPRDIVPTAVCNQCHVDRVADFGHGGSRNIAEACVMCHSPLYPTTNFSGDRADFPSMIHQIHGAIDGTQVGGKFNWSSVTFPADVKNCAFCHKGANGANYKTKPNRQACSSCHTTVNFATGANHPGGIQATDNACAFCHSPEQIDGYHLNPAPTDPWYDASLQPEYVVSMVITPPANGTYYVAGEAPTVTITLTDAVTGAAVPGSLYTTAKDGAGKKGGGLYTAGLYVYGPRENPMPVLTTGAAKTPVPTQSQSLFLPSTDPQVATTTTGFAYKLKAIPTVGTKAGNIAAGTYMVRFYTADYGYVSDTNFRVSSNAFQTIQIGTATPSKKISGDCTRCHGTGNLPPHNARHAVVFDTDQCESCHDKSGNHANLLANRIHSVHAGSALGDLMGIDWATTTSYEMANDKVGGPITYPVGAKNGDIMNCAVCHSSGNVQYTQNVASFSCRGCHADDPSSMAHILQMGGK